MGAGAQFLVFRNKEVLFQLEQLLRISYRQPLQYDLIDHTEDGSVGADTKSEGEDGDRGEPRVLAQHPQAIADIRDKVLNGWPAPNGTAIFLDQGNIAKFAASSVRRLFPGHPARHQLLDLFFEVLPNLFREITLETAS